MVKWADSRGRFLFAPGALDDANPYIDRVELAIRFPAPLISRGSIPIFLENLAGDIFRAREGYAARIRENWLFAGYIRLYPGTDGISTTTLELKLIINTTRFLQANSIPSSLNSRARLFEAPAAHLRISPGTEVATNLERARAVTFDQNDNFLHTTEVHLKPVADWAERTTEYAELVYELVLNDMVRAARRTLAVNASEDMFPQFHDLQIQVSQIEFYWEYGVDSAVRKVEETQHHFASQLLSSFRNRYPIPGGPEHGHQRNSNLVRGKFGHQDISAKLYAKSSHVVRFELSFTSTPWRTVSATRRRRSEIGETGAARLVPLVETLAEEAKDRSERLWRSFWNSTPNSARGGQAGLRHLFDLLSRSTEGVDVSPSEVLEILLTVGNISPFTRGSDPTDPVRRLKRWGVLTRLETSSTRNVRYQVARRFAPLIEEIQRLPEETQRTIDTNGVRTFEDTLAVRVRPRDFLRLSE